MSELREENTQSFRYLAERWFIILVQWNYLKCLGFYLSFHKRRISTEGKAFRLYIRCRVNKNKKKNKLVQHSLFTSCFHLLKRIYLCYTKKIILFSSPFVTAFFGLVSRSPAADAMLKHSTKKFPFFTLSSQGIFVSRFLSCITYMNT